MSQPTIETRKILEVMNDGDIVNYAMANTEILYDIFGNLSCEEIIMYTGMKNLHSPKSNRKLGTDSLLVRDRRRRSHDPF